MSEERIKAQVERAAALTPEAKARVAESLKSTVEAELAGGGLSSSGADPAAQFSRGIFFSRQTSATADIEQIILPQLADMDEQRFEQFSQRLTKLRDLKGGG